ncbi:hypothetical protein DDJ31_29545 [Streptomyces griseoviridis]|uniref:Uncharacterized protein n=1 Tax=Streptomyces griseoviridis TaxID=45398 RepID=A0ABX5U0F0_STRGD|nr:hypothetical protein DDJ31_29545 [Streptomyces griseoviridis]
MLPMTHHVECVAIPERAVKGTAMMFLKAVTMIEAKLSTGLSPVARVGQRVLLPGPVRPAEAGDGVMPSAPSAYARPERTHEDSVSPRSTRPPEAWWRSSRGSTQ